MQKKPVIGITLDWDNSPAYSKSAPWYALRENYVEVISRHNGIPVLLPYDDKAIDAYIGIIDGLMVPGGDYDLDPSIYGDEKLPETRGLKNNRVAFEMALIKAAVDKQIPILGICAGQQLLAAMYGGKLFQDIAIAIPEAINHEQKDFNIPMSKPSHKVKILPNSLLNKILQLNEIEVNSSHHQAVRSVGSEMLVSAVAPDGVIEAIEILGYPFGIGVEWHPEYEVSGADSKLIEAFVKAARNE